MVSYIYILDDFKFIQIPYIKKYVDIPKIKQRAEDESQIT